jgi:hypothetical protein
LLCGSRCTNLVFVSFQSSQASSNEENVADEAFNGTDSVEVEGKDIIPPKGMLRNVCSKNPELP